ncbi:unnamed protein product [Ixodes pacificus]
MNITMLPSLFTTKLVSEPFDHISYMQRNAFKLLHGIQKERQNRGLVTKQLNFIINVLCDQSRSSYATCMHNRGPVSVPRKYHPHGVPCYTQSKPSGRDTHAEIKLCRGAGHPSFPSHVSAGMKNSNLSRT